MLGVPVPGSEIDNLKPAKAERRWSVVEDGWDQDPAITSSARLVQHPRRAYRGPRPQDDDPVGGTEFALDGFMISGTRGDGTIPPDREAPAFKNRREWNNECAVFTCIAEKQPLRHV